MSTKRDEELDELISEWAEAASEDGDDLDSLADAWAKEGVSAEPEKPFVPPPPAEDEPITLPKRPEPVRLPPLPEGDFADAAKHGDTRYASPVEDAPLDTEPAPTDEDPREEIVVAPLVPPMSPRAEVEAEIAEELSAELEPPAEPEPIVATIAEPAGAHTPEAIYDDDDPIWLRWLPFAVLAFLGVALLIIGVLTNQNRDGGTDEPLVINQPRLSGTPATGTTPEPVVTEPDPDTETPGEAVVPVEPDPDTTDTQPEIIDAVPPTTEPEIETPEIDLPEFEVPETETIEPETPETVAVEVETSDIAEPPAVSEEPIETTTNSDPEPSEPEPAETTPTEPETDPRANSITVMPEEPDLPVPDPAETEFDIAYAPVLEAPSNAPPSLKPEEVAERPRVLPVIPSAETTTRTTTGVAPAATNGGRITEVSAPTTSGTVQRTYTVSAPTTTTTREPTYSPLRSNVAIPDLGLRSATATELMFEKAAIGARDISSPPETTLFSSAIKRALESGRDGDTHTLTTPDKRLLALKLVRTDPDETRTILLPRAMEISRIPANLKVNQSIYVTRERVGVRGQPSEGPATQTLETGEVIETVGEVEGTEWVLVGQRGRAIGYLLKSEIQASAIRSRSSSLITDAKRIEFDVIRARTRCRTVEYKIDPDGTAGSFVACRAYGNEWVLQQGGDTAPLSPGQYIFRQ